MDTSGRHLVANEPNSRDITGHGAGTFTLTYDPAGNLTDDGKDYEYVWGAWNRLVAVEPRATEDEALHRRLVEHRKAEAAKRPETPE